jgi:hypothetical protein
MFSYFESTTWGMSGIDFASCRNNPTTIRFSPDKSRATFSTAAPITAYNGEQATEFGYDVHSFDQDGIAMSLDNEQRLTPFGKPVIWVLKPLPDHMFCWGRTDWPSTGCLAVHISCPAEIPIS